MKDHNLNLKNSKMSHLKLKPLFKTTSLNSHKLWKKEVSACMKTLKAATFINSHNVIELKRFYRSEERLLKTTSQNDHNE